MKVKYCDHRPLYFPKLASYPGGVVLPNKENVIEVTAKEAKTLLRMTNGTKNCFEEIKPPRTVKPVEEASNDNR